MPSSSAGPDETRPAQKRLRQLSQSHDVLAPRRTRPIVLPAKRTPKSNVTSSAGHPSSLLALAAGNVEAEAAGEAADSSTSSEKSAQPLPAAAAMSERRLRQTTAQRARRVAEAGDLGGLTPLEAKNLAKKSAKAYKREVEGWTSWSRAHDRPLDSPADLDFSLLVYMNMLFSTGCHVGRGEKLMAGIWLPNVATARHSARFDRGVERGCVVFPHRF